MLRPCPLTPLFPRICFTMFYRMFHLAKYNMIQLLMFSNTHNLIFRYLAWILNSAGVIAISTKPVISLHLNEPRAAISPNTQSRPSPRWIYKSGVLSCPDGAFRLIDIVWQLTRKTERTSHVIVSMNNGTIRFPQYRVMKIYHLQKQRDKITFR